jgi:hypothetical protein
LATVAPVTKPPPVLSGSPRSSVTQRSATRLSTDAVGDMIDTAKAIERSQEGVFLVEAISLGGGSGGEPTGASSGVLVS